MSVTTRARWTLLLLAMFAALAMGPQAIAADKAWRISKVSGEVWVTNLGVQLASVTSGTSLKAGDHVMTGQTGRVLLTRGDESILISPNTVISIPNQSAAGVSTTILQKAGSILLEVEKRNVKHFEVETPYLAAVVKGTKFSVSVDGRGSHVDVFSGQVEVSSNKSGETALVLPGQAADVNAQESATLTLSGSGTLSPVRKGVPRGSSVAAMAVPAGGFLGPDGGDNAKQTPVASKQVAAASQSATTQSASVPAVAQSKAVGKLNSWMPEFLVGDSSGGSWLSRGDGLTFAMALPIGIGFLVTASVAAQRRWRSRRRR